MSSGKKRPVSEVPDISDFSVELRQKPPRVSSALKDELNRIIINQERAVEKIVKTATLLEAGLYDPSRSLSPLFFVGPHGSGKTYLARMFAEKWIGKPESEDEVDPLIIISGENYQERHHGNVLLGAPPGYIGHDDESPLEKIGVFDLFNKSRVVQQEINDWLKNMFERFGDKEYCKTEQFQEQLQEFVGGLLSEYLDKLRPFRSVLLVDEFEKMHPNVQKEFLGILDRGTVTLRNGNVVDLRACVIIFTGNIGSADIVRIIDGESDFMGFHLPDQTVQTKKAGRAREAQEDQRIYKVVRDRIRKKLDPALYSRIGHEGIIVFHALSDENYLEVIKLEIERVQNILSNQYGTGSVLIRVTDKFSRAILGKADAKREGARQIKRLIEKYMSEPLASYIGSEQLREGDQVLFTFEDGQVRVRRTRRSKDPQSVLSLKVGQGDEEDFIVSIKEKLDKFWDDLIADLHKKVHNKPPPHPASQAKRNR